MSRRHRFAARPSSPCRLRRYDDKVGALLALASIRRADSSKRVGREERAFECHRCRGWHLAAGPVSLPLAA